MAGRLHALPVHDAPTAQARPGPVLVVEVEDVMRGDLRDLIAENGYPVVEVENGRQALAYLIDRRRPIPSIILLDLSMPVMTGWELLAVLKSYVRLADVPVALLSGMAPQLDPIKHGTVVAYLRKPYDAEALLQIVSRYAKPIDSPGPERAG
jgi:CheY-like chemotaxis protein